MSGPTHYDVLGVSRHASPSDVRDAYRRLARRHHPDRDRGASAGAEMPAINEAYRVLSDPGRRAMYDASLRQAKRPGRQGASPGGPDESSADDDMFAGYDHAARFATGPARVPWRSLVVFSLIAIMGVVVLAQFTEPGEPVGPDGILQIGECVEIDQVTFAREVRCTGENDLVVREFIAFDRDCSNGLRPLQDRQGMGVACVETSG